MEEKQTVRQFDNFLEGVETGVASYTEAVDHSHIIILGLSLFLMAIVIFSMLYFVYKYRADKVKDEDIVNVTHNTALEVTWTVVPTILLMIMFYYGYDALKQLRTMPEDAIEIKVIGKKWVWHYEYPNGVKTTDKLYVPVDTNVILNFHVPKNDVLHSFWVPAFRTKEDTIPGKATRLWFRVPSEKIERKTMENPLVLNEYDILCAEYCGANHSAMLSTIALVEKDTYATFIEQNLKYPGYVAENDTTPRGMTVLEEQGCLGCHSLDGTASVGPSFKDIYNRQTKLIMADGSTKTVMADEAYLLKAINEPDSEIVEGYAGGIMPSYAGLINDDDMKAILDYLKTISK